ncbi:hypothetical protein F8G81_11345 [Arthrobacter sp. CDRTa11]|uniref:hypothetical protein n=1 Tax=Arthrobacter sp. CDRTa11 TaxID=2651199 RepID=UPI002265C902|nr:hypothetical protein [Arthrobacter sp. CDRTa11]UZX03124.1 hypothetical protein F8G81_11345 [Arthrobacter sp. CDRTa11]
MNVPFTVGADEAARKSGAVDSVVASLPVSLAHTISQPDIVAIDGSGTAWMQKAQKALDDGARAAIIISPTLESDPAPKSSSRILFDWAFASNPAVQKAAEAAGRLVSPAVLLESRLVVPPGVDLNQVLLDQLTAVTEIVGEGALPANSLRCIHADDRGYQFAGKLASGAPVTVSAVVTTAVGPNLRVRLLTVEESLTASIPGPDTAAPAEVYVTTPEGEVLLPMEYESAHRSTWRRATRKLSEGTDAQDFARLTKAASVVHA